MQKTLVVKIIRVMPRTFNNKNCIQQMVIAKIVSTTETIMLSFFDGDAFKLLAVGIENPLRVYFDVSVDYNKKTETKRVYYNVAGFDILTNDSYLIDAEFYNIAH